MEIDEEELDVQPILRSAVIMDSDDIDGVRTTLDSIDMLWMLNKYTREVMKEAVVVAQQMSGDWYVTVNADSLIVITCSPAPQIHLMCKMIGMNITRRHWHVDHIGDSQTTDNSYDGYSFPSLADLLITIDSAPIMNYLRDRHQLILTDA